MRQELQAAGVCGNCVAVQHTDILWHLHDNRGKKFDTTKDVIGSRVGDQAAHPGDWTSIENVFWRTNGNIVVRPVMTHYKWKLIP